MRNAFATAVAELGDSHPDLIMLAGDIGNRLFDNFKEKHPTRFYNCGVAEANMTGVASGLAASGLQPITYTITPFNTLRCLEQIRLDICYPNLPVIVVGTGAGLSYAGLGATHHSMEDVAVAAAIPNMTVLAPCDPAEMRQMTHWCATQSQGPVYMRLGKAGEPDLTANALEAFQPGKVRYLQRGTDVALLSYGITVAMAKNIAARLEAKGKSVSVLSCHTIKPLDRTGIEQVLSAHKQVAVIEEHVPHGGLGSRVKEIAWENRAKCSLETFSLKDEFIHCYGSHDELLHAHGLHAERVVQALL
jgi:transketolase